MQKEYPYVVALGLVAVVMVIFESCLKARESCRCLLLRCNCAAEWTSVIICKHMACVSNAQERAVKSKPTPSIFQEL